MSFAKGDRLRHPTKPEWRLGQVYDISSSGKLHIYFLGGGRKCLDPKSIDLIMVKGTDAESPILDTLHDATWPFARYNIYVIEMNECVWNESSFRIENPNRSPSKACLYVGMTWHTPQFRFQQHMAGGMLSANYVFSYQQGACLRQDLFESFNPMHKRLAELMEVERAIQLKGQGYGVWQR
jgi:uncharacterized protein DUF3553